VAFGNKTYKLNLKKGLKFGDSPCLSSERAPHRQDNKFQTQILEKKAVSGQTSTKWTY
jgi:hypothetical protein